MNQLSCIWPGAALRHRGASVPGMCATSQEGKSEQKSKGGLTTARGVCLTPGHGGPEQPVRHAACLGVCTASVTPMLTVTWGVRKRSGPRVVCIWSVPPGGAGSAGHRKDNPNSRLSGQLPWRDAVRRARMLGQEDKVSPSPDTGSTQRGHLEATCTAHSGCWQLFPGAPACLSGDWGQASRPHPASETVMG